MVVGLLPVLVPALSGLFIVLGSGKKIPLGELFVVEQTGDVFVFLEDQALHKVSFEMLIKQGVELDFDKLKRVNLQDLEGIPRERPVSVGLVDGEGNFIL